MPNLMICHDQFFFCGQNFIFLLIPRNYNLDALFKIRLGYKLTVLTYSSKSSLIYHVSQFCAGSSRRCSCDSTEINVISHFDFLGVDFQNFFSAFQIRQFHRNSPVKSSRTKQSRIQRIRTVCRRENYDTFRRIESVHLGQQLVQGLLALVISGKSLAVTFLSYRINLINKYNTRRFFIRLLKQVADF